LHATSCYFFQEPSTGRFMALKARALSWQMKKISRRIFPRTKETLPLVEFWHLAVMELRWRLCKPRRRKFTTSFKLHRRLLDVLRAEAGL
jgi:hypothetical protein